MNTNDSEEAHPVSKPPASGSGPAPKRVPRPRSASVADASAGQPAEVPVGATTSGAATGSVEEVPVLPGVDEDGTWIQADAVEVHQGAVGRVDATTVSVTQGAVGAARAERIEVNMGAVGAALGGQVTITQGMAGTVLAQEATLEQAFVRTLIARDVTVQRPSAVVFLVAQRVSGEIKVLLDWRGALAFGAAFGILAGLLERGRRRD